MMLTTGIDSGEKRISRIDSFAYIRVIACAGVILLHTLFAATVYFKDSISEGELLWSRIPQNLLMWCVPLFLMVTGSLLLNPGREMTIGKIYGKYLKRILLTLVIFTFIFQVIDVIAGEETNLIGGYLAKLFIGEKNPEEVHIWAHMWYFYMMTGLYLMMPFYRMITKAAGKNELMVLILLLLIFVSVVPMTGFFGVTAGWYLPTSIIYPLYLFLGYWLFNNDIGKEAAVVLAAGCSLILAVITYFQVTNQDPSIDFSVFFGYSSIIVVGQAAGNFSLLKNIRKPAGAFLRSLDECSFGIYVIHMIFVRLTMKWLGFDPYSYGPAMFILMVIGFFFVSYAITWVLRKIPKCPL